MSKIPSIALIPSGVKATKIYSVLPVDGSADLTFDRGTSTDQTRVNNSGLIEDVAVDVPRLDYSDGGCPSLLLEPASTNLITYSEDFSTTWTLFNQGVGVLPVITSNNSLSPDGSVNATRLQCDLGGGTTSNDRSYIRFGGLSGTPFSATKSLYIKNNTSNEVTITLGINNSLDAITIPADADWARYKVEGGVINTEFRIGLQGGASNSDVIDLEIWGAQLEQQSYATSYIPTSGATATRDAETASTTGLSSYINSTEGVLYAEISALANDGVEKSITINDNSILDFIRLRYSTTLNQIQATITQGGVTNVALTYDAVDITQISNIAFKYKENDFALYVNGLLVDSNAIATTFSSGELIKLNFGRFDNSNPFHGKVKDLRVYNEALSDLELARLTGFTSFLEMRNYLNYTAE